MQESFGSEWNTCKDVKECEGRVGHPVKGWRELGNGTMGEEHGPQFMELP